MGYHDKIGRTAWLSEACALPFFSCRAVIILVDEYDARVKRSKSRSCLHDKAFELGTRQT